MYKTNCILQLMVTIFLYNSFYASKNINLKSKKIFISISCWLNGEIIDKNNDVLPLWQLFWGKNNF